MLFILTLPAFALFIGLVAVVQIARERAEARRARRVAMMIPAPSGRPLAVPIEQRA